MRSPLRSAGDLIGWARRGISKQRVASRIERVGTAGLDNQAPPSPPEAGTQLLSVIADTRFYPPNAFEPLGLMLAIPDTLPVDPLLESFAISSAGSCGLTT